MSDSGIDATKMREEEERVRDEAVLTTFCAFCKWSYTGQAMIGREKALEHREKKHPEAKKVVRRKHVRHLSSFKASAYDDQWKSEVDAERKKRAFLNGVELDGA